MQKPTKTPDNPADELSRFTDRDNLQDVYQKYLHAGTQPPVLMFYGVGGTGKTWLLKKLRATTPSEVRQAFINLESPPAETSSALFQIRNQLGLQTDRFDFAYSLMRQKQGVGGEPKEWIDHAFQGGQSIVSSLPFPGSGALGGVLGSFKTPFKGALENSPLERFRHSPTGDLFKLSLSKKNSQELEEQLLTLLAEDLALVAGNHLNRAVNIVLFFDTFERIERGANNKNFGQVNEEWIKRVASEISGALIVIAGQNRLDWDRVGGRWRASTSLEQHLVGGLSRPDAEQLLHNCGVDDPPVQLAILGACAESSGGYHCFRLGLCIDIAISHELSGAQLIDVFERLSEETLEVFAERFLKSLSSDEQKRWIRRLAVTLRFDRAAAETAYSESRSAARDTAWRSLKNFSFIQHLASYADWYSIRTEMADALANQPSTADLVTEDHEFWRDYWAQRSQGPTDGPAALSWFHAYRIDRDAAVAGWYALSVTARGSVPPRMKEHFDLLQWWVPIEGTRPAARSEEDTISLLVLAEELTVTSLGDRGGNLAHAAHIYEDALQVLEREGFPPAAKASVELTLSNLWLIMPKGKLEENLRKAASYCDSALMVFNETETPMQWGLLQMNRGLALYQSHTGVREENLSKAVPYYESALRVFNEADHPQQWAALQSDLGAIWLNLPRDKGNVKLSKAIDCFNAALRQLTEETQPRLWASVQSNLGAAWLNMPGVDKQDSLRQALHHFEACGRVFTEEIFPVDWARLKMNLGLLWWNWPTGEREANLKQGLHEFTSALRVYTAEAFPQECATLHNLIGQLYQSWSNAQLDDNLNLAVQHYEAAIMIYGEPVRLSESRAISSAPEDRGDAVPPPQNGTGAASEDDWFRQAIRIDSLYVTSLRSLSKVLCRQGQYVEAQRKLERARQIAPNDAELLSDLADLLLEQERYGDAALVCIELQRAELGSTLSVKATELLAALNGRGVNVVVEALTPDRVQQSGVRNMFVALQKAVRDERPKLIAVLINLGFDPNSSDGSGRNSLHVASQVGDEEVFKYLLAAGAVAGEADTDMVLPLHLAAGKGFEKICKIILGMFPEQAGSRARDGQTPVHYAAYAGRPAVCSLLLECCPFAVDFRNLDGRTALHLASLKGQESTCELLLSRGASPNLISITGRNALHFAAQGGYEALCRILLDWPGMNCGAKTNSGQRAVDLARAARFDQVADTIELRCHSN